MSNFLFTHFFWDQMLAQAWRSEEHWRPRQFQRSFILDCRDNGKPVLGSESQQGYLWFEGTYSTAMEAADVVQFVFSEEFVNEECHISAWCWLWIDGEEGPPFFLAAVVGVEDVKTAILDLADYVQGMIKDMMCLQGVNLYNSSIQEIEFEDGTPLISDAEKHFSQFSFSKISDIQNYALSGSDFNPLGPDTRNANEEAGNGWVKLNFDGEGSYEGECHDEMAHGKGKRVWADGSVYEGEFNMGERHGQGKYHFANGDVYEGEFDMGEPHGQGKYHFTNGGLYEGEWKNGKKHGWGKEFTHDGFVLEGEWKNDYFHGQGKISSGAVSYEGEWKNGKKHGHGQQIWANGAQFTGLHIDNERVSGQILYDGTRFDGTLRTERNGSCTRLVVSMENEQEAVFEFADDYVLHRIS